VPVKLLKELCKLSPQHSAWAINTSIQQGLGP
jgi:hypothetical protein